MDSWVVTEAEILMIGILSYFTFSTTVTTLDGTDPRPYITSDLDLYGPKSILSGRAFFLVLEANGPVYPPLVSPVVISCSGLPSLQ